MRARRRPEFGLFAVLLVAALVVACGRTAALPPSGGALVLRSGAELADYIAANERELRQQFSEDGWLRD